jgi:hypothetical protein
MFFFIGVLIMLQLTTFNAANNSAVNASATLAPKAYTYIANLQAVQLPAPYIATKPAANYSNASAAPANTAMLPAPAANVVIAPAVQVPAANAVNAPAKITKAQAKRDLEATIANVLATGNALAIKHDDYFETYITKGNNALTVLLTEIMVFAETVFASTDVEAVIKALRTKLKNSYDIRVQKNSTDIGVIVRYVTRTNRKNANVYAKTLKAAFDAGKTSAELADFIVEKRKVDKIREKTANAAAGELKVKNRHGVVFYTKDWLTALAENNAIATFEVDDERELELHDMTRGCEFKYMICKRLDDEEGNKYAIIDAMAYIDKDLDDKIIGDYWLYKKEEYARENGSDEANMEFMERMKANIARYNAVRAQDGRNLLDIYGYEIKK